MSVTVVVVYIGTCRLRQSFIFLNYFSFLLLPVCLLFLNLVFFSCPFFSSVLHSFYVSFFFCFFNSFFPKHIFFLLFSIPLLLPILTLFCWLSCCCCCCCCFCSSIFLSSSSSSFFFFFNLSRSTLTQNALEVGQVDEGRATSGHVVSAIRLKIHVTAACVHPKTWLVHHWQGGRHFDWPRWAVSQTAMSCLMCE